MGRKTILKFIPLSKVKRMKHGQVEKYYEKVDAFLEWYLTELGYICEEKECEDDE